MLENNRQPVSPAPPPLLVDFHTHTIYSPDSLTTPEKLVDTARHKGLNRVVVTDHNTIAGALRCKELDPEHIIVGEEIMTTQGELLAAFVSEEVPAGLTPMETIQGLRQQNAFISVSHPFDALRQGRWELEALLAILPYVDAIETFNSRCMLAKFNRQAQSFAAEHNLSGTHGSDAHAAFELGRGSLLLPPFADTDSLKMALRESIVPKIILSSPLIHFTSRWAVWRKKWIRA
jgi:predicted metal-dependent phosphoesterase TrpH